MVFSKRKPFLKTKRSSKPRASRTKPRNPRITVNRPPNPIVSAVRNVIPLLPGSKFITPLADFVFRGFGLIKAGKTANTAEFFMTGVSTLFHLAPVDTFSFSNYCYRREADDIAKGAACVTTVKTIAMKNLTVKIQNQMKTSLRQGRWSAAFIPYKTSTTASDMDKWKNDNFTFKDVTSLPYSVTAPADVPLTIGYRFRNPLEYCSREITLDTLYGAIAIAFEDLSREDFTQLNTDEFSCSVDVNTTMRIKSHEYGRKPSQYTYGITSIISGSDNTIGALQLDGKQRSKLYNYISLVDNTSTGSVDVQLTSAYAALEDMEI